MGSSKWIENICRVWGQQEVVQKHSMIDLILPFWQFSTLIYSELLHKFSIPLILNEFSALSIFLAAFGDSFIIILFLVDISHSVWSEMKSYTGFKFKFYIC